MRIAFYIIGIVGIALAGFLLIGAIASKEDLWLGCLGGGAGAAAGAAVLSAAIKNYRGHWPFVIGLGLLVVAFGGLGSEMDDYLAHESKDLAVGVVMITLW